MGWLAGCFDRASPRERCAPLVSVAVGLMLVFAPASARGDSYGAVSWPRAEGDVPESVAGLNGVSALAGGGDHTLALLSDGTVKAWGADWAGQLGNGNKKETDATVPVRNLSGVSAISAGGSFSLALLSDGTVRAWGSNRFGQLGDGTTKNSDLPVAVQGLSGVVAISAGNDHALALLGNGTVMAWGLNLDGALGIGTETGPQKCDIYGCSTTPVPVGGLSEVTAISAGSSYSLALLRDGTVTSWGENQFGQLGNGDNTSSDVPVAVSGLTEATAIAAGENNHSLALLSDGAVVAWGFNGEGELGDESRENSNVPVSVSGLTGVTQIASGELFSMALLSDGAVMVWGDSAAGYLGDGSYTAPEGCGAKNFCWRPVSASTQEVVGIAAGSLALAYGPSVPLVTAVKPNVGPDSGGTTVTITGVGFTGVTAVKFGMNDAASFTVDTPTAITVTSPPGAPGTVVDVTVTNAKATTPTSTHDRFTYRPTVTNVNPNTGSVTGGESVTVTGSGFALGTSATSFKFGTTLASSVECSTTTACTVVVPSHAAGTVDVTAIVDKASSLKSRPNDQYTYN